MNCLITVLAYWNDICVQNEVGKQGAFKSEIKFNEALFRAIKSTM